MAEDPLKKLVRNFPENGPKLLLEQSGLEGEDEGREWNPADWAGHEAAGGIFAARAPRHGPGGAVRRTPGRRGS